MFFNSRVNKENHRHLVCVDNSLVPWQSDLEWSEKRLKLPSWLLNSLWTYSTELCTYKTSRLEDFCWQCTLVFSSTIDRLKWPSWRLLLLVVGESKVTKCWIPSILSLICM
jgi:hypothetical protein